MFLIEINLLHNSKIIFKSIYRMPKIDTISTSHIFYINIKSMI